MYTIINASKPHRTENNIRNHNTKYNVVHPQCRGYVHKLCFIQLSTKPQFDLCTQLQIPSVLNSRAHSSRPLCTQLQIFSQSSYKTLCAHSCRYFLNLLTKPSAHTAAEVVHAHIWDLTFSYKISLNFTLVLLTS